MLEALVLLVPFWHLSLHACEASTGQLADRAVYPGLGLILQRREDGTLHIAGVPADLSKYLAILSTGDPVALTNYALDCPESGFADDALLEAGIIFAGQGAPSEARTVFERLWNERPNAVRLDQTYRQFTSRGKIYPEETRRYEHYRKHISEYPNRSGDVGMVELGKLYAEAGDLERAQRAFNRVVQRYPNGQYAAEDERANVFLYYDPDRPAARALWWLAEISKRKADPQTRRELLNRAVELYPSSTVGLTCLDALAKDEADRGQHDAAEQILARKLEILAKLAEAARKERLPLRAFEFANEQSRKGAP